MLVAVADSPVVKQENYLNLKTKKVNKLPHQLMLMVGLLFLTLLRALSRVLNEKSIDWLIVLLIYPNLF